VAPYDIEPVAWAAYEKIGALVMIDVRNIQDSSTDARADIARPPVAGRQSDLCSIGLGSNDQVVTPIAVEIRHPQPRSVADPAGR